MAAHRRRLATSLEQQAELGPAHAPPGVEAEIKSARSNIARIKRVLRGWSVEVEDHPDDEPPVVDHSNDEASSASSSIAKSHVSPDTTLGKRFWNNPLVIFSFLIFGLGIIAVVFLRSQQNQSQDQTSVIFESALYVDDFNGTSLNSDTWVSNGVSVRIDGGLAILESGGKLFPYIHTRKNPFPENGDFAVDIVFKYREVKFSGTGFSINTNIPIMKENNNANDGILSVWQEEGNPMRVISKGSIISETRLLDTTWHTIRLEYTGEYTFYLDGRMISIPSVNKQKLTERPNTIWFGNTVERDGNWTSIEIDSIRVSTISSITPFRAPYNRNNFEVVATKGWQSTGIMVMPGDRIKINVTGGWARGSKEPQYYTSSDNPPRINDNADTWDCLLMKSSEVGVNALIGKIGNNDPFKIKSTSDIINQQTGVLFLRINDCDGMLSDNGGSVNADITLTR